ncbi:MAG: peptide chain release factor N(5)-glutamine methyltransferase [Firmicutes bacterium]|nr:peptide chain release factor N(5)-glutamine methyltransferase [Bacillota bacterium]
MNDIDLIKKYVSKENQKEAINKLNEGYPVQYIIGNVDFYGNIINVNENVLIPRFETEYLVEKTIKYLDKLQMLNPEILEIGTGSGCISIALYNAIPCHILAIDVSSRALDVAKKNAILNKSNIEFLKEDINNFNTLNKYDLIISNPPYVPYDALVDEKTKYEPQNAIFAENEGIYFYKVIMEKLKNNLKDNYLIAFEIGDKQGKKIEEIVQLYLPKAYIKIEKDYNNFERYVFISSKKL